MDLSLMSKGKTSYEIKTLRKEVRILNLEMKKESKERAEQKKETDTMKSCMERLVNEFNEMHLGIIKVEAEIVESSKLTKNYVKNVNKIRKECDMLKNEINKKIIEWSVKIDKLKKDTDVLRNENAKENMCYCKIEDGHDLRLPKETVIQNIIPEDQKENVNEKEIEVLSDLAKHQLKIQITQACTSNKWTICEELLEQYLCKDSTAYKQILQIKGDVCLPVAAAENGFIDVMIVLINNGLPINKEYSTSNVTVLHKAAIRGHCDMVKLLISKGADLYVREAMYNYTPLHYAATGGHVSIVQVLVEHGTDINVTGDNGNTPLHLAASWGDVSVVKCLVNNGCNRWVVNKKGKTALDIARHNGYTAVVDILSEP